MPSTEEGNPLKPTSLRHLAVILAAAALCLPATSGAGSPEAGSAARDCGNVKTRNGGRAEFVTTIRAKCRTGRRVARRAKGKRYRALGFVCKPRRKRAGVRGKLYGCGRVRNGVGQGIGFIYHAP